MGRFSFAAAASLAVMLCTEQASAQQTSEKQEVIETSIPRRGTTKLTDAAYRKINHLLQKIRREQPQRADWLVTLMWSDSQHASSLDAAQQGDWSKPMRGWVLGFYGQGQVPDQYFEMIRGIRILVAYSVDQQRTAGRRTIDYRDGRFLTVGGGEQFEKTKDHVDP